MTLVTRSLEPTDIKQLFHNTRSEITKRSTRRELFTITLMGVATQHSPNQEGDFSIELMFKEVAKDFPLCSKKAPILLSYIEELFTKIIEERYDP